MLGHTTPPSWRRVDVAVSVRALEDAADPPESANL